MSAVTNVNRRDFFRTSAAGAAGLLLGFYLPEKSAVAAPPDVQGASRLNAFIFVGSDDSVTFMIHKAEMGQGTVTSLSMLLAEELECDWKKIRTEFAPVDRAYGGMQGVFGSMSIRTSWDPLRKAGATAREMLIQVAAQKWGVDASQCRAELGAVINGSTKARLSYGTLAESAAKLAPPATVRLKDPKDFSIIGKPFKRLDTPSKVDGSAEFGIDARRPGMLYSVVTRCPVFGGKAASFDAARANAVPGVKKVIAISSGVAVVADNTWAAMQGRKVLDIKWDEGAYASMDSAQITKMFVDGVAQPGAVARKEGDIDAGLAGAVKKIDAIYEVPFLAHATMEPLNCVADVRPDSCELWVSTQVQTSARDTAARAAQVKPENVKVNTLYLGGGFGRRSGADYVADAVEVSKAMGVPIKLTWSREDDIQHDTYRPAAYASFNGGIDAEGWPVAWKTRVACPSFSGRATGVDRTSVEGLADLVYSIPNLHIDWRHAPTGIPVFYWRAVGYTQNTFFAESFLDELAAAGGKDPVEVRRRLLAKSPRLLAVLNLAAEKSGWGTPAPAGRARGVAVANNVGSFNAQVAEVSVNPDGKVKVHKVTVAVDCGHVVNPAIVEQQIRSAIVYGLSAALKGGIYIQRGRVRESNFDNYQVLRISEMPEVTVHITPTENAPGGIGESGVPAIAPAVANAIFAATGKRIRRLPIHAADLA